MVLPFSAIMVTGALSAFLLGALALRLIFAPENAHEKAAGQRIKNLNGKSDHHLATALVKKQTRTSVGRVWPVVGDLALLVRRAGLEGQELPLLSGTLAIGTLFGAVLMVPLENMFGLPIGIAVVCLIAFYVLKARHQKRVEAMTSQLPDALDLITRGLRVGHPVSATIANVGRTMADPIGAEFRILGEQISHGDYLSDAFNDLAARYDQEDVEYLAVAISIQHGTGGNLAEILATLSKVIRDRIIMRRKIRAISSEGRASAYILSALPVMIYFATSFTAPDYYSGVSDDPMFRPIAFTIVALVVGNFLALRKLVSFQF